MALTRKVVTVLFCDVTGSTALGESVDPEALRELLARYFERMSAIVGLSVWAFVVEMILLAYAPGVARYGPGPAGRAMTGDTNGADSLHLLSAPAGALLLALYAGLFAAAGVAVTRRRDV